MFLRGRVSGVLGKAAANPVSLRLPPRPWGSPRAPSETGYSQLSESAPSLASHSQRRYSRQARANNAKVRDIGLADPTEHRDGPEVLVVVGDGRRPAGTLY